MLDQIGSKEVALMRMRGMAAILAVLLWAGAGAGVRLAAQEAEVRDILAAVDSLGTDKLWPGFDPSQVPVAIYDGERTWLFRHPAPPPDFKPHGSRDRLAYLEGQHEAVRGNTATELEGIMTATLLLATLDDFPSAIDRAGVAIHEAFHAYQRQAHPEWVSFGLGLDSPDTDAHLVALRRLETDLLRRAVAADDDQEAAPLAAAAVEVRQQRFAALPESVVRFEQGLELLEGTAQHVQVTATGSRAGILSLPEEGFPPDEVFMRGYAVGFAWTELLRRLRPGWESALESGAVTSLDQALAEALAGTTTADWRGSLAHALHRAEADVAELLAHRRSIRDEFLEREGWRVIIDAGHAAPLAVRGLDPANLVRIEGQELLHTRWLRLGHSTGEAEVMDRPSLTMGAGPDPFREGFLRLTVTGFDSPPVLARVGEEVTITAPGFRGRFAGPEVEETGRDVVIRLRRN